MRQQPEHWYDTVTNGKVARANLVTCNLVTMLAACGQLSISDVTLSHTNDARRMKHYNPITASVLLSPSFHTQFQYTARAVHQLDRFEFNPKFLRYTIPYVQIKV